MKTCDVLIIGSGLGAVFTALRIDESKKILMITKDAIDNGSSALAQGGIAATMESDEYKINSHIEDTMYAGSNFNNIEAVNFLVKNSKHVVEKLIELGVEFDKKGNELLLTREGGHRESRILRAKDITGRKIMDALYAKLAKRTNIEVITNVTFTNLINNDNQCYGAYFIDSNNNETTVFSASTILATGGVGNVYKHSTNSPLATGDGIAACYRANVAIENMEFIQFHPTAFFPGTGSQKFLISETLRGEGGILRNIEGEAFMHKYHEMKDLAPRDVVSQSIFREMYDTWSDFVYLDMTHLDSEFLKDRFPNIYRRCLESGIDITKDLIPVTPCEHYLVGGIKVNIHGETTMKHLYAVGECSSTGIHGANRLASNSLLECVVFGEEIANRINTNHNSPVEIELSKPAYLTRKYTFNSIREEVRELMIQNLGVIREREKMEYTLKILTERLSDLESIKVNTYNYYRTLNIVTVAYLITKAALARKHSLGCHFVLEA